MFNVSFLFGRIPRFEHRTPGASPRKTPPTLPTAVGRIHKITADLMKRDFQNDSIQASRDPEHVGRFWSFHRVYRCPLLRYFKGRLIMLQNRLQITQDFVLTIVRLPASWRPYALYDVPVSGDILSRTPIASYEEAHDDLLRCNRHALKTGSRVWAVIERAGSPLWQSEKT